MIPSDKIIMYKMVEEAKEQKDCLEQQPASRVVFHSRDKANLGKSPKRTKTKQIRTEEEEDQEVQRILSLKVQREKEREWREELNLESFKNRIDRSISFYAFNRDKRKFG